MFDLFGYSIDSTLSGVQTVIQMFGQDLTCTAHAQLFVCASDVAIDVDKETYQCSLGVF